MKDTLQKAKPASAILKLPPGTIALTVLPEHMPVAAEHKAAITDIQPGDILLVSPNTEGQYVAERDGRPVIVGTLQGIVMEPARMRR